MTPAEKMEIAKKHLAGLCKLKGDYIGVREFRGLATYYLKGIGHSSKTKQALMEATSQQQMDDIFDRFEEETRARLARRRARREA